MPTRRFAAEWKSGYAPKPLAAAKRSKGYEEGPAHADGQDRGGIHRSVPRLLIWKRRELELDSRAYGPSRNVRVRQTDSGHDS